MNNKNKDRTNERSWSSFGRRGYEQLQREINTQDQVRNHFCPSKILKELGTEAYLHILTAIVNLQNVVISSDAIHDQPIRWNHRPPFRMDNHQHEPNF